MNLGVSGTLDGEAQPASYEGNDFGCRGAGSALRRPRRRGSLQRRTRICTGLPSTSVLGSPESMKCLSLQTSQGVVFSEAGRYYTLTPGRAVRKRRASASEGRSDSDRAERLDVRPGDSMPEGDPVVWRVDRRMQGVSHAIEKALTRGSQRMYVRTEHIWDRRPISLEWLGLAVSPRSGLVVCLGCDNPLDRRPAASGRYRYCDPAITRCPARIPSGVTPCLSARYCATSPSKR